MNIGDKVSFESKNNIIMIGIIIDKEVPRCKCKGMGNWVVSFEDGETKKIKKDDNKLKPYTIETFKNSLNFNFGK